MKDAFIVTETHAVHINPSGINSHTGHTNTPKSTVNSGHKNGFKAKRSRMLMQPCTHARMHKKLSQCCQESQFFLPGRVLKSLNSG